MQIKNFMVEIIRQGECFSTVIRDTENGDMWASDIDSGTTLSAIVNFVDRVLYDAGEMNEHRGMSPERKSIRKELRAYTEQQPG